MVFCLVTLVSLVYANSSFLSTRISIFFSCLFPEIIFLPLSKSVQTFIGVMFNLCVIISRDNMGMALSVKNCSAESFCVLL